LGLFPILVIVCATAILYCGRDVLLPITMALILAVVFSPLASLLEPYVGRVLGAVLVVLFSIAVIGVVVYFLTIELTAVADKVAEYSANIGNKLARLQTTSPPWLRHLKQALSDIQRRVDKDDAAPRLPKVIQALPAPPSLLENLRPVVPVLDGVVEFLLIIVLLFFLLYSRKDLRDRFVRLVAMVRLTIAPLALETAAQTIGHYRLLFSLTNLGFEVACGLTAWSLGLPTAPLWGLLAFLLRFVPYVGGITAALLPALVAFALFPGWGRSLEVIGSFVLLDQIAAQFVEPFIIGPGIDVSPVALLVSAMYWSWLWGLPGLLLATPLTACLKVADDSIPALGFLSLLLGGARELDDYHDFYRMLLELDATGARKLAIRYCDEHGIERTFDDVLIPVIVLAGKERAENHISQENQLFVHDTICELIKDLGDRFVRPRTPERIRKLGVCAPGEVHNLGLQMVLELLRQLGAAAKMVEGTKSQQEVREFVKSFSPQLVCLSCTVTECLRNAVELTAMLKRDTPNLTIIGGGKSGSWGRPETD
jgi:predicted PurR-regulated permease PerM